ncbi:MAG: histidine phosphatase family protein [Flavobacteriales bacterium]|nr:histidine phosphatase family protein [Flavobacteriales bacterium]
MKALYLIRHAKSNWKETNQTDFERGLNPRGNRDAPEMGKRLLNKNDVPHLIISSEANRAISTSKHLVEALELGSEQLKTDDRLYLAPPRDILQVINEVDNKIDSLGIVCHNPGISELNYALTGQALQMVTCAISKITFEVDSWKEVFNDNGTLVYYDYPKKSDF